MASTRDYLDYIKECLCNLDDVKIKMMMGDYIIHYRGKYIACICNNRLLVKDLASVHKLIENPQYELPYEGAKPMILVTETDNQEFILCLFKNMYEELPFSKERAKKHNGN